MELAYRTFRPLALRGLAPPCCVDMGTVLLAGSTLHGVAAPLAHTASRSRGAVEWNMTGFEPWWIGACAPCSSTPPLRGSPSQSCLGFEHSRASCARVPGGGSQAGSSSLEPRSLRFGSFTVRYWSRTCRGGSYHLLILCRVSESRTEGFPPRRTGGVRFQATGRFQTVKEAGSNRRASPGRSIPAPWSAPRVYRS